ncbi:MAG: hypothetical protein AB1730_07220 [Myxococcota bacterium]
MRPALPGLLTSLLLATAASCGAPQTTTTPALRFTVDDRPFPATVAVQGTRQQVSVDVTGIDGARIFDAALTEVHARLDLSQVRDDTPGQYDIILLAACSSKVEVSMTVGGAAWVELEQDSQPASPLFDRCPLGRVGDVYELSGQTNVDQLDATHAHLLFQVAVKRDGENRALRVDWADVSF